MEAFVRVVDAGSFSGAAKQLRLGQPAVSKTIAQLEEHLNRKEIFYILEVVRGRFPFGTLKQKVMEVKRRYGSSTLLIEDSPISRGLIQSLREQSINVTIYKPDTDKRARVIAQTDLFAGAQSASPDAPDGLKNASLKYWRFPGAMTIRSMHLRRGLHGVATAIWSPALSLWRLLSGKADRIETERLFWSAYRERSEILLV
jgi:Bacterial regulatory helix-turn-helix protein, lysR family